MDQFPSVDLDLLESLEKLFPDTLPSSLVDLGTLGTLVGQQTVIRFLRHQYTEQTALVRLEDTE